MASTTTVWRHTLICVGVIVGAAAVIIWINRYPTVNQAQARAVQPAIDAYMHENGARMGLTDVMDARLRPQLFCDANIIEIRTDGPRWHVGMVMNCAEYARQGNTLLEASIGYFDSAAEVLVHGHWRNPQVLSLDPGPPGYDPAWVHQNFSSRAAGWLLSTDPPTAPDPVSQARRAFGFPPGTQAVQD